MLTDGRPAAGAAPADAPRRWRDAFLAPWGSVPATIAVALILGGLALRIALMHSSVGALDSDEAIVGLMARRFASGHVNAFYWGQAYGGTIEVGLAAALFKVFGASTVALKSVPLILSGVAAILVWRVGRRVTTPGAAVLGGLLVWVWPANYLWWSIKARGFYEATLCLGLALVLVALRIGQDDRRGHWLDWALLGLIGGLGWWQSPQIGYFAAPAAVWLLWRKRRASWRVVVAIPGALAGASPWLVANLASNFASLSPPSSPVKGTYVDHLTVLVREGLPMTFGLKVLYSSRWVNPVEVTAVAYAVLVAVVVAGCAKRWPGGWVIVALVVTFPFLHALLSLASTVAEGRYTLFLLPADRAGARPPRRPPPDRRAARRHVPGDHGRRRGRAPRQHVPVLLGSPGAGLVQRARAHARSQRHDEGVVQLLGRLPADVRDRRPRPLCARDQRARPGADPPGGGRGPSGRPRVPERDR